MGERQRQGDVDDPHVAGIKQECEEGCPARAQREVTGVRRGVHGHKEGHHHHEAGGQVAHMVGGVVKQREVWRG